MRRKLFGSLLSTCILILSSSPYLRAEGSRDINGYNNFRITSLLDDIKKDSKEFYAVYFYAKKGETVFIGSSSYDAPLNNDIVVVDPQNNRTELDILKSGKGLIDSPEKERIGPYPDRKGYVPLIYPVNIEGVYRVEFNLNKVRFNKFGSRKVTDTFPTGSCSDGIYAIGVASWDITVANERGPVTGRIFTYVVQGDSGDKEVNLHMFVLSKDGFIFSTAIDSMQAFGFKFYSVNRAAIDFRGETLYHSVDYRDDLDKRAKIIRQIPSAHDTEKNITHRLFFNMPAKDLPSSIPTKAIEPPAVTNFSFVKAAKSEDAKGNAGTFSFTSALDSAYTIIIDTSGPEHKPDGAFGIQDTILEGNCNKGITHVQWDGKDRNSISLKPLAGKKSYNAQIVLKSMDVHFTSMDIENMRKGIKIKLLNPPYIPEKWNSSLVYYDDENYVSNNVRVELDRKIIDFNSEGKQKFTAILPNPVSALAGIDSSNGTHAYSGYYGDAKLIDTWTFFPSKKTITSFFLYGEKENVSFSVTIPFFPESYRIDSTASSTLDRITDLLQERKNLAVEIAGYTDLAEMQKGKKTLPSERALNVRNYLVSKGISAARISVKSSAAVQSERTGSHRTVEIMISGSE